MGCGALFVRPSTVQKGSSAMIEFYPSDQFKMSNGQKYPNNYTMIRNNVTFNFSDERHEVIEASEMRHVLEIKSVKTEDAGDYRVDCGMNLGTTNTAGLNITGLWVFCPIWLFFNR